MGQTSGKVLFGLQNEQGNQGLKFALSAQRKRSAIQCTSGFGLFFGALDLAVTFASAFSSLPLALSY
jgi:hypothetical protein